MIVPEIRAKQFCVKKNSAHATYTCTYISLNANSFKLGPLICQDTCIVVMHPQVYPYLVVCMPLSMYTVHIHMRNIECATPQHFEIKRSTADGESWRPHAPLIAPVAQRSLCRSYWRVPAPEKSADSASMIAIESATSCDSGRTYRISHCHFQIRFASGCWACPLGRSVWDTLPQGRCPKNSKAMDPLFFAQPAHSKLARMT